MTGKGWSSMAKAIQIELLPLAAAYLFLLLLLYFVRKQKIGIEGEVLIASIRMTVQLVFIGYLLTYIFARPHPLVTLTIFLIMEAFAVGNIYARVKGRLNKRLKRVIAAAMFFGSTVSLFYFLLVVLGLKPWFEPRYFIPIGGMIIGNSMTGIALGADRLAGGILGNIDKIECALMLGATPETAARPFVREAFRSAVMPTINSMMGMGIVFLPGMMTGQILSGSSPLTAITYQIAIMLGITGSVSITVYILTTLGYRTFFNAESQLVLE